MEKVTKKFRSRKALKPLFGFVDNVDNVDYLLIKNKKIANPSSLTLPKWKWKMVGCYPPKTFSVLKL
jgi:hypothetical protein